MFCYNMAAWSCCISPIHTHMHTQAAGGVATCTRKHIIIQPHIIIQAVSHALGVWLCLPLMNKVDSLNMLMLHWTFHRSFAYSFRTSLLRFTGM
uniref:Secreted protein n=1 Tax=Engystomops pustulosus TaxID=76066 RepID=A0AAV6Z2B8_ENGPU|nr:hypothetical protein GDO81_023807 [Engystomops pustulosus]